MIGDVLTSSLLFEALKNKYPEAELHYLIKENTAAVVVSNPYIDKIIFDRQDYLGKKLSFLSFIARLKREKYHAVIDVYSKIGSALLAYNTGAPLRVGRQKWYTSFLYTDTRIYKETPKSPAGKAIEFRMDLLRPLGLSGEETCRPKILLSPAEQEEARTFMRKSGVNLQKPIVMCSVLGSNSTKSYPLPYLAKVLATIADVKNVQLLFNYMPAQYNQVEHLLSLCTNKVRENTIRSCYATNLREFIAITSFCDALVGNEGGSVHMAKAVNVPTFAIFSPQIKKESWFNKENYQDEAVHLIDYKPELFDCYTDKNEVLKSSTSLYEQFTPDHFESLLVQFLDKYLDK